MNPIFVVLFIFVTAIFALSDSLPITKTIYTFSSSEKLRSEIYLLHDTLERVESALAFRYSKGDDFYYHVADKNFGPFVAWDHFHQNKNGNFGFAGRRNNEWVVVVDGKEYGPYEQASSPEFSSQTSEWSFVFTKEGSRFVRMNDTILGPFEEVATVALPAKGKGYAIVVKEKKGWFVRFRNKVKKGPYELPPSVQYSPKGSHCLVRFSKQGNQYYSMDGKEKGPFHVVGECSFSKDDKAWAIQVLEVNGWKYHMSSGVNHGPYDQLLPIIFDDASSFWSFSGKIRGKYYPVTSQKGVIEPLVYPLYFKKDSKGWLIRFGLNEQKQLFVGNVVLGTYDKILKNGFLDKSHWLVMAAKEDTMIVLQNDSIRTCFLYDAVEEMMISPSTRHYGFRSQKELIWRINVDGQEMDDHVLSLGQKVVQEKELFFWFSEKANALQLTQWVMP